MACNGRSVDESTLAEQPVADRRDLTRVPPDELLPVLAVQAAQRRPRLSREHARGGEEALGDRVLSDLLLRRYDRVRLDVRPHEIVRCPMQLGRPARLLPED